MDSLSLHTRIVDPRVEGQGILARRNVGEDEDLLARRNVGEDEDEDLLARRNVGEDLPSPNIHVPITATPQQFPPVD